MSDFFKRNWHSKDTSNSSDMPQNGILYIQFKVMTWYDAAQRCMNALPNNKFYTGPNLKPLQTTK